MTVFVSLTRAGNSARARARSRCLSSSLAFKISLMLGVAALPSGHSALPRSTEDTSIVVNITVKLTNY